MTKISATNHNSTISTEPTLKDVIYSLRGWYKYLVSKWLIILIVGILGGLIGLSYALTKKPSYVAATTFVLEDSGSKSMGGLGNLGGLASMAGIDIGGSGGGIFQGDNIIELYKSRSMIAKTLLTEVDSNGNKKLLVDVYVNFNRFREVWDENPNLKGIQFTTTSKFTRVQDSLLGVIVNDINKNYLNVSKPDKTLSIIKAEVKAPNEFFAKTFNDEIVKNVNDFYVQTMTKKSMETVNILSQKVDSVRTVLNGAIYSSASVADATPNLNPTRQIQRIVPMQRSQMSAETNKSILSELVKNLELSKISLQKETPLIQVVDNPIFPLEKIGSGKIKTTIIGGLLAGFLVCFVLISKKFLKDLLS
jgi:hypothetical protein